jgi:hypothetical protein
MRALCCGIESWRRVRETRTFGSALTGNSNHSRLDPARLVCSRSAAALR